LETLAHDGHDALIGLDRDLHTLIETHIPHPHACADGLALPFANAYFAHCLCHFYLLWISDPLSALKEMARVTRIGGWVLALAEPDYGGRISFPDALEHLGDLQTRSLELQGAHVRMGRRLRPLFSEMGLQDVQVGIIAAQWTTGDAESSFIQDQDILARDLAGLVEQDDFDVLMSQAEEGISANQSIWFVPIFYAFGRVPYGIKG